MGQIKLPPTPPPTSLLSSSSTSAPLEEDLPPAYDQVAENNTSSCNDPLAVPEDAYYVPGLQRYHSVSQKKRHSGVVTLDRDLSSDAIALEGFIHNQTNLPPRPCLIINGYHQETRKDGKNNSTENVTDFDFRIDLTRTLLRWGRNEPTGPSERWSYTTVVRDEDGQRAYRGGRIRSRGGKSGRIALSTSEDGEGDRLMDLENGEDVPGIKGWCQRFCNDPSPVKSFTYRRHLHGFDASPMRTSLASHIRSTGYQGHININPSLANGAVTIYSPHWINKARNNGLVFWTCIILQLWIITWPIIWVMERRYEVIRSQWFSSKVICDPRSPGGQRKVYAGGYDEATAADIWAPVVREAAWRGRTGGDILGEAEIEELRRVGTERREMLGDAADLVRRGQAVLDIMGVRSIGGVNVSGGWGRDNSSSDLSQFSIRTN
ncbi:hypothetical protein ARAM_003972 [Aspergillus rambellii]|uniref:Uncharacterized protein n=1 Tax=Aspergillus rambellii TaxID=308745 RepID=A0A0F8UVE2_9EURO|nr:hypothetical protein ARAM_003972 [Aspergillus rambellii]